MIDYFYGSWKGTGKIYIFNNIFCSDIEIDILKINKTGSFFINNKIISNGNITESKYIFLRDNGSFYIKDLKSKVFIKSNFIYFTFLEINKKSDKYTLLNNNLYYKSNYKTELYKSSIKAVLNKVR